MRHLVILGAFLLAACEEETFLLPAFRDAGMTADADTLADAGEVMLATV